MSKRKTPEINLRKSYNHLHYLDLVFDDYIKCRRKFSEIDSGDSGEKAERVVQWIDRTFIIRIYGLLETYGIISENSEIDQSIEGWENVKLLRSLKQAFTGESEKTILVNSEMISLQYEEVIIPLFEGCRRYADSVLTPFCIN